MESPSLSYADVFAHGNVSIPQHLSSSSKLPSNDSKSPKLSPKSGLGNSLENSPSLMDTSQSSSGRSTPSLSYASMVQNKQVGSIKGNGNLTSPSIYSPDGLRIRRIAEQFLNSINDPDANSASGNQKPSSEIVNNLLDKSAKLQSLSMESQYNLPLFNQSSHSVSTTSKGQQDINLLSLLKMIKPTPGDSIKSTLLDSEVQSFLGHYKKLNDEPNKIRQEILDRVCTLIKAVWPSIIIDIVGSLSQNLILDHSDIDLVLRFAPSRYSPLSYYNDNTNIDTNTIPPLPFVQLDTTDDLETPMYQYFPTPNCLIKLIGGRKKAKILFQSTKIQIYNNIHIIRLKDGQTGIGVDLFFPTYSNPDGYSLKSLSASLSDSVATTASSSVNSSLSSSASHTLSPDELIPLMNPSLDESPLEFNNMTASMVGLLSPTVVSANYVDGILYRSVRHTELINQELRACPKLYNLILLIKAFMCYYQLNSGYNGIGSYPITIMVLFFFKTTCSGQNDSVSIVDLFTQFLQFYTSFEYDRYGISLVVDENGLSVAKLVPRDEIKVQASNSLSVNDDHDGDNEESAGQDDSPASSSPNSHSEFSLFIIDPCDSNNLIVCNTKSLVNILVIFLLATRISQPFASTANIQLPRLLENHIEAHGNNLLSFPCNNIINNLNNPQWQAKSRFNRLIDLNVLRQGPLCGVDRKLCPNCVQLSNNSQNRLPLEKCYCPATNTMCFNCGYHFPPSHSNNHNNSHYQHHHHHNGHTHNNTHHSNNGNYNTNSTSSRFSINKTPHSNNSHYSSPGLPSYNSNPNNPYRGRNSGNSSTMMNNLNFNHSPVARPGSCPPMLGLYPGMSPIDSLAALNIAAAASNNPNGSPTMSPNFLGSNPLYLNPYLPYLYLPGLQQNQTAHTLDTLNAINAINLMNSAAGVSPGNYSPIIPPVLSPYSPMVNGVNSNHPSSSLEGFSLI